MAPERFAQRASRLELLWQTSRVEFHRRTRCGHGRPGGVLGVYMKRICLIGCCKQKLTRAAPGRDLYQSPLFRLCRRWAERYCEAWAIMSAHYGVVLPDQVVEPYDVTIGQHTAYGIHLRPHEYSSWMYGHVQARFLCRHCPYELIVLAGKEYHACLGEHRIVYQAPLDGLGIGERLAWLKGQ